MVQAYRGFLVVVLAGRLPWCRVRFWGEVEKLGRVWGQGL